MARCPLIYRKNPSKLIRWTFTLYQLEWTPRNGLEQEANLGTQGKATRSLLLKCFKVLVNYWLPAKFLPLSQLPWVQRALSVQQYTYSWRILPLLRSKWDLFVSLPPDPQSSQSVVPEIIKKNIYSKMRLKWFKWWQPLVTHIHGLNFIYCWTNWYGTMNCFPLK